MAESILKEKSYAFSVRIIKLYKVLIDHKKEYVLSKQLLRSGTAIGALIRESRNAESKLDFIHKMGIAQKECDESLYWLELLQETNYISKAEFENIYPLAVELLKMLKSSILTSKQNLTSKLPK
jgi:four helix bundle protein